MIEKIARTIAALPFMVAMLLAIIVSTLLDTKIEDYGDYWNW